MFCFNDFKPVFPILKISTITFNHSCKCTMLTKLSASIMVSSALKSKFGPFLLQISKMASPKIPKSRPQNMSPQKKWLRPLFYIVHGLWHREIRLWLHLQFNPWFLVFKWESLTVRKISSKQFHMQSVLTGAA